MSERLTLDDRALLRRLDDYFAAEVERARQDLECPEHGAASPVYGRRRPVRLGPLRGSAVLALAVVAILGIAAVAISPRAPRGNGTASPGLAGLNVNAFGAKAVVVATADGAAVVRLDGDVVELLIARSDGETRRESILDRTLRVPAVDGAGEASKGGWYLAGNAVVCDGASGLRDRGFIYGWLSSRPSPARVALTGIPARGDGHVVAGLYLFVTIGTPQTGSPYTLAPLGGDGSPAGKAVEMQGRFGVPAPVQCDIPGDGPSRPLVP